MILWLVAIAVLVVLWGTLWRRNYVFAFGILLGLPVAWMASVWLRPYVTGMEHIPLWLPPLPFAIVATTLFVYGAMIWFRADRLPPPPDDAEHDEHGH